VLPRRQLPVIPAIDPLMSRARQTRLWRQRPRLSRLPRLAAAATPSSSLKKPKTHWSGVERGCAFALVLSDVPGPKGSKVEVTVALRRNPVNGLTESVEPGWEFKAKGPTEGLMARMAAVAATTRTTSSWRPALRQLLR